MSHCATPTPADGFLAEALVLDREGKRDEAIAAFTRAVEAGSTSSYASYRLALLLWQPQMDHETQVRIETLLGRAISSNERNAAANARFGEIRAIRNRANHAVHSAGHHARTRRTQSSTSLRSG